MYATSKEAKAAKWFSRRHQTSAAHSEARAERERCKKLKQDVCEMNIRLAAERSQKEQLRRLDERLGKGVGAKKERARLAARLAHS